VKGRFTVRRFRRRWILFFGAVVILVVALLFGIPAMNRAHVQGELTTMLSNARQLHLALQTMSLDDFEAGKRSSGFPADIGVKTAREYFDRLLTGNYLTRSDLERLLKGADFAVANVSISDPPDTAFLISRSYFDMKSGKGGKGFIVFAKGGSGGVYRRPADASGPNVVKLPNRQPRILPEE
jgi:hypothetical protein